jgi:hypothetical protein
MHCGVHRPQTTHLRCEGREAATAGMTPMVKVSKPKPQALDWLCAASAGLRSVVELVAACQHQCLTGCQRQRESGVHQFANWMR